MGFKLHVLYFPLRFTERQGWGRLPFSTVNMRVFILHLQNKDNTIYMLVLALLQKFSKLWDSRPVDAVKN